jgi:heme-degrading monooxygenase HmoA
MFGRVWEFRPAPERLDDFRRVYGAQGAWAELFATQPGFLGTSLLVSLVDPTRCLTLDRWAAPEDWAAFLAASSRRYAELDRECDALVIGERELCHLRTARAEDADAMATLSVELGYPVSPAVLRRRLEGVGRRSEDLVLVAV